MKGLCYIVLILGFFIFFQQNPLYAIIIIVIGLGVYILFKSRSSNSSKGVLGFLTGAHSQQDNSEQKKQDQDHHIDRIKSEVLELLDEE